VAGETPAGRGSRVTIRDCPDLDYDRLFETSDAVGAAGIDERAGFMRPGA